MGRAMNTAYRLIAPVVLAAFLSACAADQGSYPSLARRDAERIVGTMPVAAPAPESVALPATPAPELARRLSQLIDQARTAHGRFTAREPRARTLSGAARGAAMGSESWASAAIALADLESARSDAMIALADLDALYAAARVESSAADAIAAARDQVTALVGEEDAVLAELRIGLKG
jgi:hypothetical protein